MSTLTALHKVLHKMKKAVSDDEFTIAILLSMSGAFSKNFQKRESTDFTGYADD